MRVGITLTGSTMGGPTGVGDASIASQMLLLGFCGQISDTASGSDANEAVTIENSDAS